MLELSVDFSPFKAAVRSFSPKEEKFGNEERKLRVAELKRNVKSILNDVFKITKVSKSYELKD